MVDKVLPAVFMVALVVVAFIVILAATIVNKGKVPHMFKKSYTCTYQKQRSMGRRKRLKSLESTWITAGFLPWQSY